MKKLLLALSITGALLLTACSNEEEKTKESTKDKTEQADKKKDTEKEDKAKASDKESTEEPATQQEQPSVEEQPVQDEQAPKVAQEPSQQAFVEEQQAEQPIQKEEQVTQEDPVEQAPVQSVEGQSTQETESEKIDLNELPAGDFSTEGMSPGAKQQIEDLSNQKDNEGLDQEEYNDRVSDIMNEEMGY